MRCNKFCFLVVFYLEIKYIFFFEENYISKCHNPVNAVDK